MKTSNSSSSRKIEVWNTGRWYTEAGQIIAAVAVEGGVIFNDVSRMIDGFVVATPERIARDGVQRVAMWGYDTGAPTEGGGYKYNYGWVPSDKRDVLSELSRAASAFIAQLPKREVRS